MSTRRPGPPCPARAPGRTAGGSAGSARGRAAVALLAVLLAGCGPERAPDRLSLHRRLALAERVLLVVPAELADDARAAAGPRFEVRLLGQPLPPGPRVVVAPWDAPEVAPLVAPLGLDRDEHGLGFARAPELGRFDLLAATLADPQRAGLPLTLVLVERVSEARPYLDRLVATARPGFSAWNRGQLVCEGELELGGGLAPGRARRVAHERLARADQERRAAGIVLRADQEVDADAALADLEATRDRALAAAGERGALAPAEVPVVRVRLFAHPEDLFRATGREDLWVVGPAGRSAAGCALAGLERGGAGYARALGLRLLGAPRTPWVADALAVHAADAWWGRPLERWCARLRRGGLVPAAAAEVFDRHAPHSPHLVVPLRALFLRDWLASGGDLPALWGGQLELDLEGAWPGFLERLDRAVADHAEALDELRAARAAELAGRRFRWGANLFAPLEEQPAGDGPGAGFGTRACERSLSRLQRAGANAVALLVDGVSFAGPPRAALEPPAPGPRPVAGDLALVASMLAARGLDLGVMVRPLLRESPSGTWAGDHAEESERQHRVFFERYGAYLVHTALLAELGRAELLCAGTELGRATRTDPDDDPWIPDYTDENDGRWRGLVAAARGAFDGALTYAADGRGESDRIGFLDALDQPAIDLYPQLVPGDEQQVAASPEPSAAEIDQRLRGALLRAAALGRRAGAPCLVTEIGFPASSLAWQAPDETRGAPDAAMQARLLEALVDAYLGLRPPIPGLGGIYLYGWSTDPEAGRALDESFSFQNRPGEAAARRLFRSARRREGG